MLHSLLKYVWLIATVLWFVFMTALSHQNGAETYQTSLKLAEFLGDAGFSADLGELNGWLRRAAHVVLFLVLAVLISVTLKVFDVDWRLIFLVFLWAIIDEWTKIFIDGRHFSWCDVFLGLVGCLIGVIIGVAIRVWV